jgi:uncharacterized protein YlxW (UPF0749 family)
MADLSIIFGQNVVKAIDRLTRTVEKGFSKMEIQTQELVDAVNRAATKLAAEVQEVADTIAGLQVDNSAAQAVIDEQVVKLNDLATAIENMVPTPPPAPMP